MVPWDRDKLPTLHGSIPARTGEMDASHISNYWKQHEDLINNGVDAFWPDEGDWFDLFERIKRHQLYYQGPLSIHLVSGHGACTGMAIRELPSGGGGYGLEILIRLGRHWRRRWRWV